MYEIMHFPLLFSIRLWVPEVQECVLFILVTYISVNPEYSLGGLMLKLKLRYLGLLIRRANSLGKTLMLGKIEARIRRG